MLSFSALNWVLLILGAFTVGLSKTALPGLGTITVALFAAVLPARESTAALLLLLLVGDVFAIIAYRRSADWRTLRALIPAVLVGIILGAIFLRYVSNDLMKRSIGIILLALIALTLVQRYGKPLLARKTPLIQTIENAEDTQANNASDPPTALDDPNHGMITRLGYGTLAGFTTMAANAGGPVMSLYLLSAKFDVMRFLGTSAWFFFTVNVIKLPFSASIGLIGLPMLQLVAWLIPATIAGALSGLWLASRMTSVVFDPIVWALTVVGASALLF